MRWLLVLFAILIGIWLWRSARQTKGGHRRSGTVAPDPQQMIGCALCSVHIPAAEAVRGRMGAYCCAEHRNRAEP